MGVPRKQMTRRLGEERARRRTKRVRVRDGHLAAAGLGRRAVRVRKERQREGDSLWHRFTNLFSGGHDSKAEERQDRFANIGQRRGRR